MSSFVENLYQNVLLADSAYLVRDPNQNPPSITQQLVARGFTDKQISNFNDRYAVVDFQPNIGGGFAATIYEDTETGLQFLAIRGTEADTIGDLLTDFEIALFGQATAQCINKQS